MQQLRYYQRDAKNAVEFGWEMFDRQVMKLPTGAGKTFTVAKLFQDMHPGRCLFLADQDELVQQPRAAILRATGIIPAVEKAKDHADLRAQVVVASSQTLAKEKGKGSGDFPRLFRFPSNHFDYIVIDECHRRTDADIRICDHFDKAKVCGVTATPFRANLADLSHWFERVAYNMDILDLVDEGFAPPPKAITLPVEIDIAAVKTKRGNEGKDFDLESVDTTIAPYYKTIAEMVVEYAKGRYGIAYLPLIKSSEAFAAILRSVGLRAYHIDGTSSNRDALLHAFEHGEIDWLCNSNLLSTGVDIPRCDAFLNLRLTHSRAWYQQARGRAMRVLPGIIDHLPEKEQAKERRQLIANSAKPNALILDLLLQNDRLGAANTFEDFTRNQHDAQALFERAKKERTPFEIAELAKRVQEEREAALVSALERAAIRSALNSPMTADQTCALIGARDLLDYVPIQRWEQEKPTPRQIEALVARGIDATSIKSKGQASALIDLLIERGKLGFATVKQVKLIRQLDERKAPEDRVRHPEQMSVADANAFIDAVMTARRRAVA